jgi:hypothetical protein
MMMQSSMSQIRLTVDGREYVGFTFDDVRIIGSIFLEEEMYKEYTIALSKDLSYYKNIVEINKSIIDNKDEQIVSLNKSLSNYNNHIADLETVILDQNRKLKRNNYIFKGGVVLLVIALIL